jgi:hypothetical protein
MAGARGRTWVGPVIAGAGSVVLALAGLILGLELVVVPNMVSELGK